MPSNSNAFAALLARAPFAYRYLAQIVRDGWAWEYLRRSEHYRTGWQSRNTTSDSAAQGWNLCSFR